MGIFSKSLTRTCRQRVATEESRQIEADRYKSFAAIKDTILVENDTRQSCRLIAERPAGQYNESDMIKGNWQ